MQLRGWRRGWLRAWQHGALALLGQSFLAAAAFAADAQITSLVDTPDPVAAGGIVAYAVRVDNNAPDAATNTRLRLAVPSGATFLSATPAGANCAPLNATTVECNLGTVAALGSAPRDVTFNWRALGPGPTTVTANAEVLSDNDSNAANNTQAQTTTVNTGANLALAKAGAPNPVVGGSNVTYTLTVSNAGPNAAGSLRLVDTLPPSVSFVSASGAGWTCSASGGTVTCTRPGPHALGAGIPAVTIVGQVNASGGTVTNSATVEPGSSGGVADPDTADNTATADTTVLPGADVRIAQKTVTSPLPAIAGTDITFRIQPRNGGPAAATSVTVTDTLPAGWTFVSASGANWTCGNAGQTVSCTRAAMPAGAADDITLVARAPGNATVGPTGTSYTNTASIGATSTDPNGGNNSGAVAVNVLPDGADLRLAKSKTPNPVAQGSNMTSTIVVTNNGPRAGTGPLRVLERLTGETFVSGSGSGWTCSAVGTLVTCDHANAGGLAVNASLPALTIVTTATAAGAVSNQACSGGSVPAGGGGVASPPAQGDPNATNDCVTTSSNSTTTRPDISIAKTTSTPTGGDKVVSTSEGSVTYTLVVTNASAGGPEPATGIRIEDAVPGWISGRSSITTPVSVVVSGGSSAAFSCAVDAGAGRVACTQSGGVLANGQTATVTIVANRPLQEGSYTNTATVFNTTEGDPNAANNSASDTVTIAPIADVEMTGKSVTPASVRAGEEATYVLSFRNNGPSPAAGVTVADTFTFAPGDTGLTVISVASSASGSSCALAAGAQITLAAPSFNCTIGTLANGETQSITLVARPNWQPGNAGRSIANLARVDTTSVENPAGGDNGNNERSTTLAVQPAAVDLLVNKTDRIGPVNLDPVGYTPGATFLSYRVSVTNNGPSFASGVTVTESMTPPPGRRVRFVCDTTAFGSSTCNAVPLCTGAGSTSAPGATLASFTCQVPPGSATTGAAAGTLGTGQTKNLFLRFEVLDQPSPTGDVYNNLATVAGNEPDTQAGNNSEGEATTTRQRVDLRTSKAASVAAPTLMQPFNWVVTVTNGGPGNSLQTDVTDTLPEGAQVTGPVAWTRTAPAGSGTCTVVNRAVTCGLGQLNANGAATITVPLRFTSYPAGGTATNTATVDTDPIKTGGIDTPGGNNTGTQTISVTRSSLAGTVFEDRDRSAGNGGVPQAAASEPRIAGASVRLTGTDAYGNAVDRTATTDASGNYVFDNLAPSGAGGYTITQTQPGGYANGPVAPPTAGANAPGAGGAYAAGSGAAGNSSYSGIALGGNAAAANYNFPEVRQPSLAGFVYVDADNNGVRTAGTDPPIANATVRLLNANTLAVIATTTTDGTGAYTFANLDPFTPVVLEEPLPGAGGGSTGFVNGPVNPGQIGGAACAAGCTAQPNTPTANIDRIAAIDLSSGADGTNFNFGERQFTGISGLVWLDSNRDAALQPGETTRLAGVSVRLVQGADCTSGTTLATTTTGADGVYRFDNVTAHQNYLVCQTQPAGYGTGSAGGTALSNAIPITNLPAAGSADNNFGETLAAIAGSVYADYSPAAPAQSNNGVRDAGEAGIAGVTVTLAGRDALGNVVNRTTTTDASGHWRFDDLFASDASGYTVSEGAVPASSGTFNDGRDTAGSAGGSAAVNDVISAIVLPGGTEALNNLFGELPIAPISGTVYLDRNTSGTLDPAPTDGRLGGVTITARAGTDCTGAVAATTVTGSDGTYLFSGLSAGLTYTVCQTQPPAYADAATNPGTNGSSAAANAITVTALPAAGAPGQNFGERAGAIAGSVYLDADNNGARAGGETAFAGVTMTLSGSDITGAPVTRTTTTDATGNWRFDDLPASGPGGYTVTEQTAQPAFNGTPTINGRTTPAAGSGGTGSSPNVAPSVITGIALAPGATSAGHLFGEILPVAISGTVFIDLDNNGTRQAPAEGGIAGVTITVTGTDDTGSPVTRSTTTDTNGNYTFPDLRPGTYTVTQPVQPPGTGNGITSAGSAGGTATPVATVPSAISGIVLTASGAASTGNNFAEIATAGAIEGRVWLDADNNGVLDAAEAGIAGVAIELRGTDSAGNAVARNTTTDAAGRYAFTNLAPGTYLVREPTQPASTVNGATLPGSIGLTPVGAATAVTVLPSAVSGITLGANQASRENNFGEVPTGSISGRVYADNNNNGTPDAGETGYAGVQITLTGTDDLGRAVNITVTTGADGSYAFPDLRPGTYTLTQATQPAGTVNGITTPGTGGGSATSPQQPVSSISGIVLGPGTQASGNHFGEIANSPDLRVGKEALATPWTVGHPGSYRITVRNAGEVATSGVYTVRDRLPTGITLAAVPSGTGWTCAGPVGAATFECTNGTAIAAGATLAGTISVPVRIAAAATAAPAFNRVLVEGGGEIEARAPSAAERAAFTDAGAAALPECTLAHEFNVCRTPTAVQLAAAVSGTVWLDNGSAARVIDGGDRRLGGWTVEVVDAAGTVVGSAVTGNDGTYRVGELIPGLPYTLRFREPGSTAVFGYPVNGETAPGSSGVGCDAGAAQSGRASSCVGTGANPFLNVILAPGQTLQQQSLPVDPSGVVYDSVLRQPVPGSVVTLTPVGACAGWNPAAHIVGATLGGYRIAGSSIAMTVGPEGLYQFLFAPSAPASCTFSLAVTPPVDYSFTSRTIPPEPGTLTPPGAPGSVYPVQPQAAAPTGAAPAATTYYLTVVSGSGGANIVHNHIPLDPAQPTTLALVKTGDRSAAEVGDSVRYTLTVRVAAGPRPRQTTIVDRLPAGFTYIRGTASVNDVPIADPRGGSGNLGPTLAFNLGPMPAAGDLVLRYRVRVNVGAQQGDGINTARAHSCGAPEGCVTPNGAGGFTPQAGSVATNEARYRVRVSGGVFTTDACVLGKIFVDCNNNHVQDREELGIPGVRLVMTDGTTLVSDSEGKYSVCGVPPKSHVLKVDPLTLPRGSRLATSSNRNLGDAGSLWLDLKNGELHRADFVEGSCSNTVLEQVKARRAQGEVRAPEPEKRNGPALRFDSKAHGLSTLTSPQQGSDGANQRAPKPRAVAPAASAASRPASGASGAGAGKAPVEDETNVPTPALPMNRPAPKGRDSGTAADAPAKAASGGADGSR